MPRHYRGWLLAYVIFIHELCPAVAALWGHRLPSLGAGKSLVDPIPLWGDTKTDPLDDTKTDPLLDTC